MKTFKGTFANGAEYMGVEVPGNAQNFTIQPDISGMKSLCYDVGSGVMCQRIDRKEYNVLGKYYPGKGVEFEVKEEWVSYRGLDPSRANPRNYVDHVYESCTGMRVSAYPRTTKEDSLRSLLDRDSRQKFPLDENPAPHPSEIEPTLRAHYDKLEADWREAEEKVRPRCFVILITQANS